MDKKIPWNAIIHGFKGFEELALEFVKSEYSRYNWQKTGQSWDGNKDAEAVFLFCFNNKIWMEAKYSTKYNKLTRYKLDSTIVSAILDQKVKKLFFVTNINIKVNTRNAIIRALKNGLGIINDDVIFCTCHELEIWLLKNPRQFDKFFKGQQFPKKFLDKITIIDKPAFYLSVNDGLVYNEPLDTIFVDENYNICFSLYSPQEYSMKIESKNKYLKISNKNILLCKEKITYIKLNVHTLEKGKNPILTLKYNGNEEEKFDISTNIVIAKNKYSNVKIILPKNQKVEMEILKKIKNFIKPEKQFSEIITLFGSSATGKSHLIKEIFSQDIFLKQNVIYISFNYDQNSNIERLLGLMIRFYFHLWESIDDVDTNNLHKNIPSLLKVYIDKYKQKQLTACNFIEIVNEKRELCFSATHLNKRIIIIDDAHKLDRSLRGVLSKFFKDIICSKTNILGIIIGQEDFSYLINSSRIINSKYELSLNQESLLKCLDENGIKYNKEFAIITISDNLLLDSKINVFFIKSFISYIKCNNEAISEIDVIDILNQYIHSDKFKESIFENIKAATYGNEEQLLFNLLHIIYFSLSGINPNLLQIKHRKLMNIFIKYQLVRNDESNKLVPVHDLYSEIFREEFGCHQNNLVDFYKDKLYSINEKIRYEVSQNMISFQELLNHIKDLISSHQYYIVLYTLSTTFNKFKKTDTDLSFLYNKKNGIIQYEYYKLFYLYIYSLGHTSRSFRSYNIMKQMEEHLKQKHQEFSSKKFMLLRSDILGEIINGAFRTLDINSVNKYSEVIKELLEQIKEDEPNFDYTCNGAYILMKEINVLTYQFLDNHELAAKEYTALLKHCDDINFLVKCAIIRIRYARGLYASDLNFARSILIEADSYLQGCGDIKWKQIKDFESSYIDILLREGSIDDLKINLNKLKIDLYNDYRGGLRTVCAYYLFVNRIDHFDVFFKEYLSSPRPLNERDRGLMHHLIGLKYFLTGEYKKALNELKKQKLIFQNAGRSYKSIIEHNIRVTKDNLVNPLIKTKIKFKTTENNLKNNVIYIEPRLW